MKTLVLTSGEKLQIIGESGKFWLCDGTQFRKTSRSIASVVDEIPEDAEEEVKPVEPKKQTKPKSKKATAKKQAGTEEEA